MCNPYWNLVAQSIGVPFSQMSPDTLQKLRERLTLPPYGKLFFLTPNRVPVRIADGKILANYHGRETPAAVELVIELDDGREIYVNAARLSCMNQTLHHHDSLRPRYSQYNNIYERLKTLPKHPRRNRPTISF